MNSIVEIFKGSEKHDSTFTVYSPEYINNQQTITFNEIGYSNQINLSREQLIENIINIQLKNGLKPSSVDDIREDSLEFSIEMETGTGKTYVYLRTIMELYQKYGLSKFIIVVPSISIKEGVYKSLQITQDHYRQLYDNIQYNYFIYNSGRLSDVRNFSANNGLEIMVINIDAFSKSFKDSAQPNKANIIHRYHDSLGGKPLDFIRNTRPIVIIDEPQSTISTPLRKTAVQNLNPLVTLRYSATHREKVNLVFKLDAVDAYAQKLVKQIEVGSVQASEDRNNVYIKLKEVILSKGLPIAKVEVDVFERGSVKRKIKKVRQNTDLEEITKRNEYEGYIIKDIYGEKGNEYIDFTSREDVIKLHESIGEADELQIKRVMISKTIEEHLDKEMILNKKSIKVLSLFFIDRVMNYRGYDDEGNPT
ncbi:MAG: DEAD/DEAH box helicase family protein, partial [Flavobacteriaceae bacterium]|nr:DEAD/DEAH box helicase family protein [Flavobacteriaceae bacterium]